MVEEINPISPYPSSVDIGTSPVLEGLAQFTKAASEYVGSRALQQQQARDENLLATAQLEIIKNGGKIPDNILQQSYAYQNALKMAYGNYLGSESYKGIEDNVLKNPEKYFDQNTLNQEFFAIDDKLKPQVEGDWRTQEAYASATVKNYQRIKEQIELVRVKEIKRQGQEVASNNLRDELKQWFTPQQSSDDADLILPSRDELGLPDDTVGESIYESLAEEEEIFKLEQEQKIENNQELDVSEEQESEESQDSEEIKDEEEIQTTATAPTPEPTIPFSELGIETDAEGIPIVDVKGETSLAETPIPVASRNAGTTTIKPSTAKKALDTGKFERKVYSSDGQLQQVMLWNEQGMPVILAPQWMKRLYEPKQEVTATQVSQKAQSKYKIPQDVATTAQTYSQQYNIDPEIFLAIAWHERASTKGWKDKYVFGYGAFDVKPWAGKYAGWEKQWASASKKIGPFFQKNSPSEESFMRFARDIYKTTDWKHYKNAYKYYLELKGAK